MQKIRLFRVPRKEPYLLLSSLNIFPKNIRFYEVAFSHKSSAHKINGKVVNNERLEYLGDGILDAVVADILYHKYPNRKEGFLTSARAAIVKRDTLNKVATDMKLDQLVPLQNKKLTHNLNVYGNAFEALVGALFLDRGYDDCRRFVDEQVLGKLVDVEKLLVEEQNFKSKLLEWAQKYKADLQFELLEESVDKDSNPQFKTIVKVNGIPAGIGTGYSKRESQQCAAQKALIKVRNNKTHFLTSNVLKNGESSDEPEAEK